MICDTSALLAAYSADQQYHIECASALEHAQRRLISPVVLTEIDYLARRILGRAIALRIMRLLTGPEYQMLPYTQQTLVAACDVMATYGDLDLGVVDASLVAHAKEVGSNEILTLDQRHFRAVRGLDGRHFKLLPFDMD
ncbi:MAG: type II toxin-antitoxin system VapC family toxin [Acidimicrobiia bacterium]